MTFLPNIILTVALLNKSNFQVIDGSDHDSSFQHRCSWQSKSLKSPTGLPTTTRSGNVVHR
ncbi:hypothetical protein GUO90_004813 [Salmonella enterica]|nr:hypothetical protein [Salmonella enterica]